MKTETRKVHRVLPLALVLMLGMGSCVGRIQQRVYLQWVPHMTADRLPLQELAQLEVLPPSIPLFYDDYRLVYRSGAHRLVRSSTLLWYERPRVMLHDWLLGRVRQQGLLPAGSEGRWVLGMHVDLLQVVLTADRKRAASVSWAGRIFLRAEGEEGTLFLDFSEEEPIPHQAGSGGIAAAFVRMADRLWERFRMQVGSELAGRVSGEDAG